MWFLQKKTVLLYILLAVFMSMFKSSNLIDGNYPGLCDSIKKCNVSLYSCPSVKCIGERECCKLCNDEFPAKTANNNSVYLQFIISVKYALSISSVCIIAHIGSMLLISMLTLIYRSNINNKKSTVSNSKIIQCLTGILIVIGIVSSFIGIIVSFISILLDYEHFYKPHCISNLLCLITLLSVNIINIFETAVLLVKSKTRCNIKNIISNIIAYTCSIVIMFWLGCSAFILIYRFKNTILTYIFG